MRVVQLAQHSTVAPLLASQAEGARRGLRLGVALLAMAIILIALVSVLCFTLGQEQEAAGGTATTATGQEVQVPTTMIVAPVAC